MNGKELRDLLSNRLYIELQLFKYSILGQTKEEIYRDSYKIEVFANTYEILLDDIENVDEEVVCVLLYQNFSILEFLYQEWLSKEDSVFDELKGYIKGELETIAQINNSVFGKERVDGTGIDKVA